MAIFYADEFTITRIEECLLSGDFSPIAYVRDQIQSYLAKQKIDLDNDGDITTSDILNIDFHDINNPKIIASLDILYECVALLEEHEDIPARIEKIKTLIRTFSALHASSAAAASGHEAVHGTKEEKQAKRKAYRRLLEELRVENPDAKPNKIYELAEAVSEARFGKRVSYKAFYRFENPNK
jgi:hypothetical protein